MERIKSIKEMEWERSGKKNKSSSKSLEKQRRNIEDRKWELWRNLNKRRKYDEADKIIKSIKKDKKDSSNPLSKLIAAEKKIAEDSEKKKNKKEKISSKIGKSKIGLTLGKGIHNVGQGFAKAGGFLAGAASGTYSAFKGKGTEKIKEHIWSKNQFDKLIWIGLIYYAIQWYYKLVIGIDVFNRIPYEFMIINFIIAIAALIFCFKPTVTEIAGTISIIMIYFFIIQTGYTIPIPNLPFGINGEILTLISLIVMTVLIGLIWRHFLNADISGMIGVSLVFLLEISYKIFFATQAPIPILINIIIYMPYWFLLGIILGGYVEGGTSKLVGFFRGTFILIITLFLVSNLLLAGTSYGSTQFSISKEKQEQGEAAFKEGWDNFVNAIGALTDPFTCIGPNMEECMKEKAALRNKKEPTEEEKLLAVANEKKPSRISLYFSNINQYFDTVQNENYENIKISTQLNGQAIVDKQINLACSINEIRSKIIYPKEETATIKADNLAWYQDILCQPIEKLKTGVNEVEFLALWRQYADTKYVNYFMEHSKYEDILKQIVNKGPEYSNQIKQCGFSKDKECINKVKQAFYSQIPELEDIETDYPDFNMKAKYDDEPAAILIENTAFPLIGVPYDGKTFNLRFSVLNNGKGQILGIKNIYVTLPDPIEYTEDKCDILEKSDRSVKEEYQIKKNILNSIDWSSIRPESQKIIPGLCELKVEQLGEDFKRATIWGNILFDYQLKNKFDVQVYGAIT